MGLRIPRAKQNKIGSSMQTPITGYLKSIP